MKEIENERSSMGTGTDMVKTTEQWLSGQTGVEMTHSSDGKKLISLPPDLEEKTNCLVPFSQVVQISPNYSPIPKVVQLHVEFEGTGRGKKPTKASDVYKEKDGNYALKKTALTKIAGIAGIEKYDTIWDHMQGTGVSAKVIIRRRNPDGTWEWRQDTKTVRFRQMEARITAEAEKAMRGWDNPPEENGRRWKEIIAERIAAEYEHIDGKVESKAFNRCVRSLLSVKPTYTEAELKRPFFVIAYASTPDLSDPNTRELVALERARGTDDLYGGGSSGGSAAAPPPPPPPAPAAPPAPAPVAAETPPANIPEAEAPEPAEEAEAEAEDVTDAEVVEDEPQGDGEKPPKPEEVFKFTNGPHKNKTVEEVVSTAEGMKWLAEAIPRQRSPERQASALAWLSWATGEVVTLESLTDE